MIFKLIFLALIWHDSPFNHMSMKWDFTIHLLWYINWSTDMWYVAHRCISGGRLWKNDFFGNDHNGGKDKKGHGRNVCRSEIAINVYLTRSANVLVHTN